MGSTYRMRQYSVQDTLYMYKIACTAWRCRHIFIFIVIVTLLYRMSCFDNVQTNKLFVRDGDTHTHIQTIFINNMFPHIFFLHFKNLGVWEECKRHNSILSSPSRWAFLDGVQFFTPFLNLMLTIVWRNNFCVSKITLFLFSFPSYKRLLSFPCSTKISNCIEFKFFYNNY